MSDRILEKIKINRPRENAGSNTYNRFQFQIAFAADLIIKLSKQGKEALAFIDYLDDVVIVDKSNESNVIIFYQVKSKDMNFITLNIILNNKWFEKMAYNNEGFQDEERKFVLVTNTGINFNGKYVRDTHLVSLSEFLNNCEDKTIEDKILTSMSNNLNVTKEEIDLQNYFLLRTELTIDDYERQLKGELQVYANEVNPKLDIQSLDVIYMKLFKELQKKQSTVYNPTIVDIDELLAQKSYSTADFKRLVNTTYQVQIPTATELHKFLKENNFINENEFINLFDFRKKYDKFSVEAIANGKIICSLCFSELSKNISNFESLNQDVLIEELTKFLDLNDKISNTEFYSNNKFFICSTFLFKYYEGVL